MGLFRRRSKEEKRADTEARFAGLVAERPHIATPYTGEPFPAGGRAAVAVPGQLDVALAPGAYTVDYRISNSGFGRAGTGFAWRPPTIDLSMKPADGVTPRLQATVDVGQLVHNPVGWSWARLYRLEVPAPGGTYRFVATGSVIDDEAHLLVEDG